MVILHGGRYASRLPIRKKETILLTIIFIILINIPYNIDALVVLREGTYFVYSGWASIRGIIPDHIDKYHNKSYSLNINISESEFNYFITGYPSVSDLMNLTINITKNYVDYMVVDIKLNFFHEDFDTEFNYLYEKKLIKDKYSLELYRNGPTLKIEDDILPFMFFIDTGNVSSIFSQNFIVEENEYKLIFGPFNVDVTNDEIKLYGGLEFNIIYDGKVPYQYSTSDNRYIATYNSIGIATEIDTILTFLIKYGYLVHFYGNLTETNLPLEQSQSIFNIISSMLDRLKNQLVTSFGPFGIAIYYAILTLPVLLLISVVWMIYRRFVRRG